MNAGFASRLYRWALYLYPPAFRAHFAGEMGRVFDEGLCEARSNGVVATVRYFGRVVADLLASALREQLAAMNGASVFLTASAVGCGCFVAYIDFHATEVQATLLVIVLGNSILGCIGPKQAWRRALLVGACLPLIHLVVFAVGDPGPLRWHPYFSRLLILVPSLTASCVGAYLGVFVGYCWRQISTGRGDHRGPSGS